MYIGDLRTPAGVYFGANATVFGQGNQIAIAQTVFLNQDGTLGLNGGNQQIAGLDLGAAPATPPRCSPAAAAA